MNSLGAAGPASRSMNQPPLEVLNAARVATDVVGPMKLTTSALEKGSKNATAGLSRAYSRLPLLLDARTLLYALQAI